MEHRRRSAQNILVPPAKAGTPTAAEDVSDSSLKASSDNLRSSSHFNLLDPDYEDAADDYGEESDAVRTLKKSVSDLRCVGLSCALVGV